MNSQFFDNVKHTYKDVLAKLKTSLSQETDKTEIFKYNNEIAEINSNYKEVLESEYIGLNLDLNTLKTNIENKLNNGDFNGVGIKNISNHNGTLVLTDTNNKSYNLGNFTNDFANLVNLPYVSNYGGGYSSFKHVNLGTVADSSAGFILLAPLNFSVKSRKYLTDCKVVYSRGSTFAVDIYSTFNVVASVSYTSSFSKISNVMSSISVYLCRVSYEGTEYIACRNNLASARSASVQGYFINFTPILVPDSSVTELQILDSQ